MTTVTKLPYDETYVTELSKENNEQAWMTDLHLGAINLANQKPYKTKIHRWNFTDLKHKSEPGETITSLDNVPEELNDFVDKENENIVILRNQTVAYASLNKELQEKGVILTDIFTAL